MSATDETIDRQHAALGAVADSSPPMATAVDALQLIVSQVDSFLSEWLQRLDESFIVQSTTETAITAAPDDELRKRFEQFQLEKRQWDAKREKEIKQIEEKFKQLTEAWLRLEDERRTFLQVKESSRAGRLNVAATDVANRAQQVSTSTESRPPANRQSVPLLPIAAVGDQQQHDAVRQFEQLRQQIDSSRHPTSRS